MQWSSHSKKVASLITRPGAFRCKCSLRVLRLPPSIQKHACEANWEFWIDCEWLFVSLCDPVISCGLVLGAVPPSPQDSRESLQHPQPSPAALLHNHGCTRNRDRKLMNEWHNPIDSFRKCRFAELEVLHTISLKSECGYVVHKWRKLWLVSKLAGYSSCAKAIEVSLRLYPHT